MIPILLLFVTATYRPATPTIGDPITIEYSQPVTVQPSPQYEIVSRTPTRVVVRTFEPRTITVHATGADLEIPIKSVLAPNDALKPAPLRPPRELPPSRTPWIAIAIAALCAVLTWLAVLLRRVQQPVVDVVIPSDLRFRNAVRDAARARRRWAALADATRTYVASVHPELGVELTTAEVLARSGELAAALRPILRQGDLEKFSPWGAEPADFDAAALSALELIVTPVREEEVAA
jgi:hypothetical protein